MRGNFPWYCSINKKDNMKNLMTAVLLLGILATVMAQEEEPRELIQARASYQSQLKFAAQSYLQKLESMRKMPSMKSQVDVIRAEIASFKKQVAADAITAAANAADQAPEKPGANTADIKAGKLTEFPKDITSADWDRLPGKVIRVNAEDQDGDWNKNAITIKDGDSFYAVPSPSDKWNLNRKVSCNWEGVPLEGMSGSRAGRLAMWAAKTDGKTSSWTSLEVKTPLIGPLKFRLSAGYSYDQYPRIYYKGEIRVKLVPAE